MSDQQNAAQTAAEPAKPAAAADPAEKTFDHALDNGGVQVLRLLVGLPGWAKGPVKQRKAIKLWKKLPRLEKPDGTDDETWQRTPYTLILTERQRDLAKECLRFMSDQGRLGNDESIERLLYEFGVLDSDPKGED